MDRGQGKNMALAIENNKKLSISDIVPNNRKIIIPWLKKKTFGILL